jgi:hypothetical protein
LAFTKNLQKERPPHKNKQRQPEITSTDGDFGVPTKLLERNPVRINKTISILKSFNEDTK